MLRWVLVVALLVLSSRTLAQPVVEAPVVEAPVVEAPVAEAPVVEALVAEAPAAEAPAAEAPVVEDLPSQPTYSSPQGPIDPSQAPPPVPQTPPAPLAPSEPIERATDPLGGWRAFGGQTFFLLGAPLAVGAAALGADGEAMGAASLGTAIIAGGGAFLFSSLARKHDWNPRLGDALAGVYPGLLIGSLVGGLVAANTDRHLARGLGFGAVAGAAVASWLFSRLARSLDGSFSRPGRGGRFAGVVWAYVIGAALLSIPIAFATDRPEVITAGAAVGGLAGLVHVAIAPRLRF